MKMHVDMSRFHSQPICLNAAENRAEDSGRRKLRAMEMILAIVLSVGLGGCGSNSGEDVVVGELGLPLRDGVECLGEDAQPRLSEVVYVSPDGDDANSGDRADRALNTLSSALCNLVPGQTLRILPGTYAETVIMGSFGNRERPIIIQGVDTLGQKPVLNGENHYTTGIALVESANIAIINLEFRSYTDAGLQVIGGSDISIEDNLFFANGRASVDPLGEGYGVNVDGTQGVRIVGNEAAENGPAPERVQKGILGTGINTFGIQDAVIRDNDLHNNIGGGLLIEDGVNVIVESNEIYENELDAGGEYWDGGIWVDGGYDVVVRDNTISDNLGPGLEISDEDVQYPNASYGYVFSGNIIRRNLFGVYLFNFGQCPLPDEGVASFTNNVIENNEEESILCEEWACGEGQACQ